MDLDVSLWRGSLEDPFRVDSRSGRGAESELREGLFSELGRLISRFLYFEGGQRHRQLTCGGFSTGGSIRIAHLTLK